MCSLLCWSTSCLTVVVEVTPGRDVNAGPVITVELLLAAGGEVEEPGEAGPLLALLPCLHLPGQTTSRVLSLAAGQSDGAGLAGPELGADSPALVRRQPADLRSLPALQDVFTLHQAVLPLELGVEHLQQAGGQPSQPQCGGGVEPTEGAVAVVAGRVVPGRRGVQLGGSEGEPGLQAVLQVGSVGLLVPGRVWPGHGLVSVDISPLTLNLHRGDFISFTVLM